MVLVMVGWRDPNMVPIKAFYEPDTKVNFCGKLATDHHVQVGAWDRVCHCCALPDAVRELHQAFDVSTVAATNAAATATACLPCQFSASGPAAEALPPYHHNHHQSPQPPPQTASQHLQVIKKNHPRRCLSCKVCLLSGCVPVAASPLLCPAGAPCLPRHGGQLDADSG